jgi:prepilin-type N-terminal cleavage/methylation domain-containing protein
MKKTQGFTLFELLIGIAILGIITTIALPNLSEFLVKMRVDGEISQFQRMFLTARNGAVNTEQTVTVCSLDTSNTCQNNWTKEITVFTDINNNGIYEPAGNEEILKIKDANTSDDTIKYDNARVSYSPSGLLNGTFQGTLKYCPKSFADLARGITITSRSGRIYTSVDTNNDGIEEDRNGNKITCS